MKQKVFIVLGLAVLIVVLIGLNAVSYTQKEKMPDNELMPNRSTYNLGATGTRALFDLLTETGRKTVRWQEPPDELRKEGKNKPATFVIIGRTQKPIGDEDAEKILQWVAEGGRLVIIDREPPPNLVKTTANWEVLFKDDSPSPDFSTDSSDQKQMTAGIKAAKPAQPTIFTKDVNGVQTSRFTTSVNFHRMSDEELEKKNKTAKPTPFPTFSKAAPKYEPPPDSFPTSNSNTENYETESGLGADKKEPEIKVSKPTPKPVLKAETAVETYGKYRTSALSAPVAHLDESGKNILVDVPYGAGQIVFLTDPYVVANGGINLVDNARLAVNLVASRDGIIAFDEYHQGYGSNTNRLLQFFAGTPLVSVFLQAALLIAFIFFSQSRRFARPLPEPEPDRLSKLEYVSAMAELQQRTKGYDLAIENIYTDFRRRVSRLVGVDALKTRKHDLALLIVERLPEENAAELEDLMEKCEDVMHGGATNKKQVLQLTTRLREIEEKLGLQRRKRQRKAV